MSVKIGTRFDHASLHWPLHFLHLEYEYASYVGLRETQRSTGTKPEQWNLYKSKLLWSWLILHCGLYLSNRRTQRPFYALPTARHAPFKASISCSNSEHRFERNRGLCEKWWSLWRCGLCHSAIKSLTQTIARTRRF